MKFVMSYSCGKDSTLALHHMIAQGHEPIALLTMFNEDAERTFFHTPIPYRTGEILEFGDFSIITVDVPL